MNLLFFLIIPLLIIGITNSVYAEVITTQDATTDYYFNTSGQLQKSVIHTYNRLLDYYDSNGNPVYVPYKQYDNGNQINFETANKSYSLDKSSCTLLGYDGGKITQGKPITKMLSHTLKSALNGTDVWNDETSNAMSCDIQVFDKQIIVTKSNFDNSTNTGTSYSVIYDFSVDGSMEWTYKTTNKDISKTDQKYGFTSVCEGSDCDTILIDGVPVNDGETKTINQIKDKKIKIKDLEFDTKNYEHGYTWALKKETNKMIVDFTNAKRLDVGDTLIIDPIFGYSADSGTKSIYQSSCSSGFGDNSPDMYIGKSTHCFVVATWWNITTIPNTSTISSINVRYDVITKTGSGVSCNWKSLEGNGSTMTNAQIHADAQDGTTFVSASTQCNSVANDKVISLGSSAVADLQAELSVDNEWGVGISPTVFNNGDYIIFGNAGTFELEVTYTISCSAPTNLNAKTYNSTQIVLTWTKPSPSCDNTNYKVYKSTSGGSYALETTLGNVTTATISSLSSATTYAFKVATNNTLGYSSNSTVGTNSTTPDAPIIDNVIPISKTKINVEFSDNSIGSIINWKGMRYVSSTGTVWINSDTNSTISPRYENVTGLTENTIYIFQVREGNEGGFGDWSQNGTATTMTTTSGTLSFLYTNVGDIFLLNGTLSNTILSPTPQTVTTIRVIDNGTIFKTTTPNDSIIVGSNNLTFIPIQITDNFVHSIYLSITATNNTGTVIINSSAQNLVRGYSPTYQSATTPSEGDVYYFATRSGGDVTLTANRDKSANAFQMECAFYNNDQARLGSAGVPTWVNVTNVYFYQQTASMSASQTVYYKCYNSNLLFQSFINVNGTDALLGGFESLDGVIGNWMGVPIVTLFIIFLASMATKSNSTITIIAILVAIGIMGGIGLFTMDAGLWALIMIMGTLAIVSAKLGFD